jgi:sterol desaturase/sphingolipid hydroxylase (fatty acid hydroxylase superfamily)
MCYASRHGWAVHVAIPRHRTPLDPDFRTEHFLILNQTTQFLFSNSTAVQICWFLLIITSLWYAETIRQPHSLAAKYRHAGLNSLFITTALPIQVCMMLLCLGVSRWTTEQSWGLVYLFPNHDNPWIKYGLMFVFMDFLDYIYHVTMHNVKAFWRFHLVHHSDLAVDVSTTVREHPGESFIRNCFLILWVFICGASMEILLIRQIAQTAANLSSHSSVRLPTRAARVIGWLVVTPNHHHAHHHFELPTTNSNYGDVFTVWDRLFGTFETRTREELRYGLQSHLDGSIDSGLLALVGRGRALLARLSA